MTVWVPASYKGLPLYLGIRADRLIALNVGAVPLTLRDGIARPSEISQWQNWFNDALLSPTEAFIDRLDWGALPEVYKEILMALRLNVPMGSTVSYGALALQMGRSRFARVVGTAMAKNPFPILFPCHRVLRGDGQLGNYSGGGIQVKMQLLQAEGARLY